MGIKQRVSEYCNYKNIAISKFESLAGISNGYFNNIKKRPSDEKIENIHRAFPDLNTSWLLTGEGEMLKNSSDAQNIAETPESGEAVYTVPLLPVSAQGGSFNDFVSSVKEVDCEKIVSPVKSVDLAITVSGDSMAPEYPSGCKILIKRINEKAFIEWGKVYVLDTCNGTVIKEVHRGKSEEEIECYSINPDPKFQPFSVRFSDIFGMYRVILCMSLK